MTVCVFGCPNCGLFFAQYKDLEEHYSTAHCVTDMCPQQKIFPELPHGPKQPLHACLFRQEIGGDSDTLCECCEECERQCADDI